MILMSILVMYIFRRSVKFRKDNTSLIPGCFGLRTVQPDSYSLGSHGFAARALYKFKARIPRRRKPNCRLK